MYVLYPNDRPDLDIDLNKIELACSFRLPLPSRKANLEGTSRELGDADWEKLITGQSASEKWETFKDQMCRVQSKSIPMRCKTRSRNRPGWLSSENKERY